MAPDAAKASHLHIRAQAAEIAAYKAAAASAGLPTSEWVRQVLTRAAKRQTAR